MRIFGEKIWTAKIVGIFGKNFFNHEKDRKKNRKKRKNHWIKKNWNVKEKREITQIMIQKCHWKKCGKFWEIQRMKKRKKQMLIKFSIKESALKNLPGVCRNMRPCWMIKHRRHISSSIWYSGFAVSCSHGPQNKTFWFWKTFSRFTEFSN